MHIAMFSNTYLPHVGGVARSVARFTDDLRHLGHRVLVVAPVYPGCTQTDAGAADILRVPAIQRFNGSDFSMRLGLPFLIDQRIDEFAPDLIHSHHPYLLGDAAVRAAKRRRLPLIFTHHTRYEEYTHYVTPHSETMKHLAMHLATEYANMCDLVVAPSESIAALVRQRGVETPVACIPTGVDTETFAAGDGDRFRRHLKIADRAVVIGHVGRLAPEKNLDFLTEAMVDSLQRCRDAVFLLVGDGPSRRTMVETFEAEGLADRLWRPGILDGRDLADAYRAMNLFVFASRSETQGMVLTEAMAAGVPVIALDAPGVREVVADGENGRLLAADAAPRAFAGAVAAAVEDNRFRRRAAAGARETARRFDRRTIAAELAASYARTIAAHGQSEPPTDWKSTPWDALLNLLRVEWDLLAEKASAVAAAVSQEEPPSDENTPQE
jgi:glycosyltransferase involved in cell wall biosynthesis